MMYTGLVKYALKFTKAYIEAGGIFSYVTKLKLGYGVWKTSIEAFILHCIDQVKKYADIVKD